MNEKKRIKIRIEEEVYCKLLELTKYRNSKPGIVVSRLLNSYEGNFDVECNYEFSDVKLKYINDIYSLVFKNEKFDFPKNTENQKVQNSHDVQILNTKKIQKIKDSGDLKILTKILILCEYHKIEKLSSEEKFIIKQQKLILEILNNLIGNKKFEEIEKKQIHEIRKRRMPWID